MRPFAAGELTATVSIAMPLARISKEMVYVNTSAVGGRVFVRLGQRKRCDYHAAIVVRIIAWSKE